MCSFFSDHVSDLKLDLQVEWAGGEPCTGNRAGSISCYPPAMVVVTPPATGSAEHVMLHKQKMRKLQAQFW